MSQHSRARRTLILILIAITLIVASVWIGGAWIVAVLTPLLPAPALWGVSGVVAVLLATVPPLYVALRLLSLAGDRAPHRPTVSLSILSLYNLAVVGLILGLIAEPTGTVLQQQGRWVLFGQDAPLVESGITATARLLNPKLPAPQPTADGAGAKDEAEDAQGGAAEAGAAEAGAAEVEAAEAAGDEAVEGAEADEATPGEAGPMTAKELFAARADAVVVVRVQSEPNELMARFGMPVVDGHGSGFVVDGGLIITNHHVIDQAKRAEVELRDGRSLPVSILVEDKAHDLALLKIPDEALAGTAPPTVALAAGSPAVGEVAFAIGAPLGLEFTLTQGIVSGSREIGGTQFVQMQTPVAPGSSGGPLFDERGAVIGVNTAIKGLGMNLAVDIQHVQDLLEMPQTERRMPEIETTARVVELRFEGGDVHPTDADGVEQLLGMVIPALEGCLEPEAADAGDATAPEAPAQPGTADGAGTPAEPAAGAAAAAPAAAQPLAEGATLSIVVGEVGVAPEVTATGLAASVPSCVSGGIRMAPLGLMRPALGLGEIDAVVATVETRVGRLELRLVLGD